MIQLQNNKAEAEADEAPRKAAEYKQKILKALEKSGRSIKEVLELMAKE